MKADFYYECAKCKGKIPATFDNPNPATMQSVVAGDPSKKTETTFRCDKCRDPERA